jgi:hypothetical protein
MAMLRGVLLGGLMVISFFGHAQRYARANGNWANPIWAATPGGVAGSAATPTATDDVYTNGFLVTVAASTSCRNLFITYNLANSLTINSLRTLTVTGTLNGYDDAGATEEFPNTNVLTFGGIASFITFTATNIQPAYDPYLIFFWDNTVSLGRVTFNLGSLTKNIIIPLSISQQFRVQSGTLVAESGSSLTGNSAATFLIDAGASFTTDDPISNFTSYTISGSLNTTSTISAVGTGSVTIASTGAIATPTTLTLSGNFSNSGTFTPGNGTVTFNGTGAQSVTGTTTFNNINCNTTGGGSVNINGSVTLNGDLTLSSVSAIFDADGSGSGVFTIASTSQNAGGRIATLPNPGNFVGNVTIQRFIHSQSGGDYRYLSMPVTTNENNLSRWKAAIGVTGGFSDRSVNAEFANISDAGNTNPSVFTWNGTAYVAVTGVGLTSSIILSSRTGYVAYNYNNGSVTASYRGEIETGSVPISISNANGNFNLVPNPYPSRIDFDNISKTTINNSLWLRIGNNTFTSYVGGVAVNAPFGGWTGEIAIGQSFWTQSNGGGSTLTLNESDKTSNAVRFLRTETPVNYVRLTLSGADQLDEAIVRFADGANDELNGEYDAVKRRNGNYVSSLGRYTYLNVSTFTTSATNDYAINTVGPISCEKKIGIKVADVPVGSYTLKFTDFATMDIGYTVTLIDRFTNQEKPVSDDMTYSFNVTSDANSFGSGRFELKFSEPDIVTSQPPQYTLLNQCSPTSISVSLSTQKGVNYQIFKGSSSLSELITGTGGTVAIILERNKLADPINVLDVKAITVGGCSNFLFAGAINVSNKPIPSTIAQDVARCGPGQVTLTATGAPTDGAYKWYSSLSATTAIEGNSSNSFQTSVLDVSRSYYVSALNSLGCEGTRLKVDAVIKTEPKPVITQNGFVLTSSIATDNQWLKNGKAINGATSSSFEVNASGEYTVVNTNNGCSGTAPSIVMVVTALDEPLVEGISIYPNPTEGSFRISLPKELDAKLTGMSVYNTRGILVSVLGSNQLLPGGDKVIDLTGEPASIYLLNLSFGNEVRSFRIVKK